MHDIQTLLAANRAALCQILGHPGNIGIELSEISIQNQGSPPVPALLCWVEGLSDAAALSREVLEPLSLYRGAPRPDAVAAALPVARKDWSRDLQRAVDAMCNGSALLLAEGWDRALILDTATLRRQFSNPSDEDPSDERFRRDLHVNIAMLRWRVRTPQLRAELVPLSRPGAGQVALVYHQGSAARALVRLVRCWVRHKAGEERAARGEMSRSRSIYGLLPRFQAVSWPDKATMLLEAGYVLIVADRLNHLLVAPVTAAALFAAPADGTSLNYPMGRWLARFRLGLYLVVLLLPGAVVALLNYHQEMVPTVFMLAVASVRENAAFGIPFEVLTMELLVDLVREASFRLPTAIPTGLALIGLLLLTLLLVQAGFIGPLPAAAALIGSIASLALPSYGGAYLVRFWRYLLIGGAILFGFFGIATVFTLFVTYLCQHRSWGYPFLRPWGYGWSALTGKNGRRTQKGASGHDQG